MAKAIIFSAEMDALLISGWGGVSPNVLAFRLSVSVPTLYRRALALGLKVNKTPRNKICLTDKQMDYLVKHFKNTDNFILADDLGISESTLHRIARRLGLKKTRAYMKECQASAAAAAGWSARQNGRKPPKDGGIAGRFKKGVTCRERLGELGEKMRIAASAATRRKTIARERWRVAAGLPQKTKLRLVAYPSGKVGKQRFYLRQCGYIVDGLMAYYGPDTVRRYSLESRYKYFTFKPIQ